MDCSKKKKTLLKILNSLLTIGDSLTSYVSNTERLHPVLVHSWSLNHSQPQFFITQMGVMLSIYDQDEHKADMKQHTVLSEMLCKPHSTSNTWFCCYPQSQLMDNADNLERTSSCCLITHTVSFKPASSIGFEIALLRGKKSALQIEIVIWCCFLAQPSHLN